MPSSQSKNDNSTPAAARRGDNTPSSQTSRGHQSGPSIDAVRGELRVTARSVQGPTSGSRRATSTETTKKRTGERRGRVVVGCWHRCQEVSSRRRVSATVTAQTEPVYTQTNSPKCQSSPLHRQTDRQSTTTTTVIACSLLFYRPMMNTGSPLAPTPITFNF